MQLLEMTMPADFETLRQQKGASLIFTTLEILEDIERSSDSILIRCTRAASLSKLRALFTAPQAPCTGFTVEQQQLLLTPCEA